MEDVQHQFSIMGMWNAATPIGKGVVIVLLIMSVWSLTIAVERLWRFQQAKKQSLQLALGITPLLKQHKLSEAINYAKDKKFRHSHLARVLAAGLTEFQYETSQELPEGFDLVDSGKRAIEREALMTSAEMKKGLGNLATIATTSPFIGLFGTVIGIITAFQGMALTGSGGLGAVSPASPRPSARRRSASSWPCPRSGCTTTSSTRSSASTSRCRTPARN